MVLYGVNITVFLVLEHNLESLLAELPFNICSKSQWKLCQYKNA